MSERKKDRDKEDKFCKGLCTIKRNDETLSCFVCETVYHLKCTELSKEEQNALKMNENSGLVYLCNVCKINCKNNSQLPDVCTSSEVNELKTQISKLSSNINDRLLVIENKLSPKNKTDTNKHITEKLGKMEEILSNKVESMGKQIVTYTSKVSSNLKQANTHTQATTEINKKLDCLKTNIEMKFEDVKNNKMEEKLVLLKKNNICIFNLPESKELDQNQKYKDDINNLKELFSNKIKLQKQDILEVYRIGKNQTSYPRPIIMKLATNEKKMEILKLRNLYYQNGDEEIKIYICHDRTVKQQIEHKKLVLELKEKKMARKEGENDWMIRNGKVVQYKPPFRPAPQDYWGC